MKVKMGKYIWRPGVFFGNLVKGIFFLSFCGFYGWVLLTIFLGGWEWIA